MHSLTYTLPNPSSKRYLIRCFAFLDSSYWLKLQVVPHVSAPREDCRNKMTETATNTLANPRMIALLNPNTIPGSAKRTPTLHRYAQATPKRGVVFYSVWLFFGFCLRDARRLSFVEEVRVVFLRRALHRSHPRLVMMATSQSV